MSLQIQSNFNNEGNQWEIKAIGDVDISTAPKLRECLDAALQEKKANIVLHLEDLDYIDSTGLGVIIGTMGKMKEDNKQIILVNPKDNIKKLLSITNLDRILCPKI
ncbi:MAG: STAS domain-containing protein [Anaerovoracaceae bacterium]|jgi:anti-sigma B factor antagonist|nr:STAS domain-containing protein [Clostridiales bacterium]